MPNLKADAETLVKALIIESYNAQKNNTPMPLMTQLVECRDTLNETGFEYGSKGEYSKRTTYSTAFSMMNTFIDAVGKTVDDAIVNGKVNERKLKGLTDNFKFINKDFEKLADAGDKSIKDLYAKVNETLSDPEDVKSINEEFTSLGTPMTARKWIEKSFDSMDDIVVKGSKLDAASLLAQAFAARLLADQKKQKPDACEISPRELRNKADELLKDTHFMEYLDSKMNPADALYTADWKNNLADAKYRLENYYPALKPDMGEGEYDRMLSYVKAQHEAGKDVDGTLYGHALPAAYSAYAAAHKEDYLKGERKPVLDEMLGIDSQEVHAAKMMAAFYLSQEKGEQAPMNDKVFKAKTRQVLKMPEFRILAADPKALNAANKGDFAAMAGKVSALQEAFDTRISDARLAALKESLDKLTHGPLSDPKAQKYVKSRSPEFQKMVKSVKKIVDARQAGKEPSKEMKMEAMASILEYQKGKEQVRFWEGGRQRFNQSMELAMSLCGGSKAEVYLSTQINKVNEIRVNVGDKTLVNSADLENQHMANAREMPRPQMGERHNAEADITINM